MGYVMTLLALFYVVLFQDELGETRQTELLVDGSGYIFRAFHGFATAVTRPDGRTPIDMPRCSALPKPMPKLMAELNPSSCGGYF